MDSTTVKKVSVKDNSSNEESVPHMNANIQKRITDESSDESDSQSISSYEKLRLKNIEEREQFMRTLGIQEAVQELKALMPEPTVAPPKKRVKIEREPLPKREPSERVIYLAAKPYMKMVVKKKVNVDNEGRLLGLMPMTIEKEESRDLLVKFSKMKFETNIDSDVDSCDIKGLQERLSSFRMTNNEQLFDITIESLEFHPTTETKLVIAGSSYGGIGFWDLELKKFATFKPHRAKVSCLSVSTSEPTKVFSTSYDGSFLCCNLEYRRFSKVYATDLKERVRRLAWHDQLDANSFLLAHCSGRVGMLDVRDRKVVTSWYPCFESSAKTVHHHPIHGNYFVVCSGSWYTSNVYDLRNCSSSKAEPVSMFPHNKGLASAFFSPSGDKVLTTCKDDFLRIYTSPLTNKPSLKKILLHKNYLRGRGSEFKAKWYPGRDDSFVIGSLLTPSKIQVYGINGKTIKVLKDSEIKLARTPQISVHPSLPFVAAGNYSGKVYIFSTEDKEPQT